MFLEYSEITLPNSKFRTLDCKLNFQSSLPNFSISAYKYGTQIQNVCHSPLVFQTINMAPKKRIAHGSDKQQYLSELTSIRNSLQLVQQSVTRLERTIRASTRPLVTMQRQHDTNHRTLPAQRRLLQRIADGPLPTLICWQHKMHGAATRNCGGPPCPFYVNPNAPAPTSTLANASGALQVLPPPIQNAPVPPPNQMDILEEDLLHLSDTE